MNTCLLSAKVLTINLIGALYFDLVQKNTSELQILAFFVIAIVRARKGRSGYRREHSSLWTREEIHKKKDRLECANYRGISLTCHRSKIFTSIILQRIKRG